MKKARMKLYPGCIIMILHIDIKEINLFNFISNCNLNAFGWTVYKDVRFIKWAYYSGIFKKNFRMNYYLFTLTFILLILNKEWIHKEIITILYIVVNFLSKI